MIAHAIEAVDTTLHSSREVVLRKTKILQKKLEHLTLTLEAGDSLPQGYLLDTQTLQHELTLLLAYEQGQANLHYVNKRLK